MEKARTFKKLIALIMAMTMIFGGVPSLVFAEDIMDEMPAEEELFYEEPDGISAQEELLFAEDALEFADDVGELFIEEEQEEELINESELYFEEEPVSLTEEELGALTEEVPEALTESEPEEEILSDDSILSEEESELEMVGDADTEATFDRYTFYRFNSGTALFFKRFEGENYAEDAAEVDDGKSNCSIYTWVDGDTWYWWSDAETVYLPADANQFFFKGDGYYANGRENLKSIELKGIDSSRTTNMKEMFGYCESLTELDLDSLDTSKCENMYGMLRGCKSMQVFDLDEFDTSACNDMRYLFAGCESLKSVDLNHFDTSNVTQLYGMFSGCQSLVTVDLKPLNTSNVSELNELFKDCSNLMTVDVAGLDTSNVSQTVSMFEGCRSLKELDLSDISLDTTKTKFFMSSMFKDCSSLETIYAGGHWDKNYPFGSSVFDGCDVLQGGKGTVYDATKTGPAMARLDGYDDDMNPDPDSKGYLTFKELEPEVVFEITKQPDSIEAVSGKYASFNIGAEGIGLTYQWQYKLPTGKSFVNAISAGSNTPDWEFKVTNAMDGRSYRCIVTDANGSELISEEAVLKIKPLPVIIEQPDNIIAVSGKTAVLHILAEGDDLTYQWQYKRATGTRFVNAGDEGAKSPDWEFVARKAWDGSLYRCVVTDKDGATVISNEVTFSIAKGPEIYEQPEENIEVKAYEEVTLHVAAIGDNLSYQWQKKLPTSNTFVDAADPGANSADWTFTTYKAWDGRMYRCVITDELGVKSISDEVYLHVTP